MFFAAYLLLIAMMLQYRVFLAIMAASMATYLFLRFKLKDDVALGKALLVFFGLLLIWAVVIWFFVFPKSQS